MLMNCSCSKTEDTMPDSRPTVTLNIFDCVDIKNKRERDMSATVKPTINPPV